MGALVSKLPSCLEDAFWRASGRPAPTGGTGGALCARPSGAGIHCRPAQAQVRGDWHRRTLRAAGTSRAAGATRRRLRVRSVLALPTRSAGGAKRGVASVRETQTRFGSQGKIGTEIEQRDKARAKAKNIGKLTRWVLYPVQWPHRCSRSSHSHPFD